MRYEVNAVVELVRLRASAAQITPRSLTGKASTACFVAPPVNMAQAGARVGMHQHGETKCMASPRQSIVQPQPITVNALPRRVGCAWRCAVPVQHAGASEQAQENLSPEKK